MTTRRQLIQPWSMKEPLNISNKDSSGFPTNGNRDDQNLTTTNTNMNDETSCDDVTATNGDFKMSIDDAGDVIRLHCHKTTAEI